MPLPARRRIRDLSRSVNEMAAQLAAFEKTVRSTEQLRLLGQVSGGLAHQCATGEHGARLVGPCNSTSAKHKRRGRDFSALEVALRQLTLLETHVKAFSRPRTVRVHANEKAGARWSVEAVELLRPRCQHAGIELHWQPPQSSLPLTGDAGELRQLVVNLLGNTIDAAGTGGDVGVQEQTQGTHRREEAT